jgi:hypothetical protein
MTFFLYISSTVSFYRAQMDDYLKKLVETLTPSNGTSNLAMEVQGTNSFVQAFRASADTIARQPNH